MCRRRCFSSFIRLTHVHFTLLSCFFTPQRIRLAFAFLFVGENVFIHYYFIFSLFTPLKRFVWLSPSCVLEKTCLFISSQLKRAGGLRWRSPPPFATRGPPFEEGFEGDFRKGIFLCVLEKIVFVESGGFHLTLGRKAQGNQLQIEASKSKARGATRAKVKAVRLTAQLKVKDYPSPGAAGLLLDLSQGRS